MIIFFFFLQTNSLKVVLVFTSVYILNIVYSFSTDKFKNEGLSVLML